MDKSAADSFIYAKASGILGKSFINQRTSLLFNAKSLSDLWILIFNNAAPSIPEKLLAQEIERQAFDRLVKQYIGFVNLYDSYSDKNEILLKPLFIYEAENLKEISDDLCKGEKVCPALINLGKVGRLNYSEWPNLKNITQGSPFSWIEKTPDIREKQKLEFKIDIQVVRELWSALEKTSGDDYEALHKLFENEYIIKNIVWALRLKKYYRMSNEEIMKNLISVTDNVCDKDPLAEPAIKILSKDMNDYSQWANWKYSELINPQIGGENWTIDPNWIEKTNRVRLNKVASLIFHQYPMSTAALIAWFKIKNFELSCIRTAVESLRLGINSKDAMNTLGIL